jgi:hypothetical protein
MAGRFAAQDPDDFFGGAASEVLHRGIGGKRDVGCDDDAGVREQLGGDRRLALQHIQAGSAEVTLIQCGDQCVGVRCAGRVQHAGHAWWPSSAAESSGRRRPKRRVPSLQVLPFQPAVIMPGLGREVAEFVVMDANEVLHGDREIRMQGAMCLDIVTRSLVSVGAHEKRRRRCEFGSGSAAREPADFTYVLAHELGRRVWVALAECVRDTRVRVR